MNISEFAFRIILIFIPGFIALSIRDSLTSQREVKSIVSVISSLLSTGLGCYAIYYVAFVFLPSFLSFVPARRFYFVETLTDSRIDLNFPEIILTTALSIPFGLLMAKAVNSKWFIYLARLIGVSQRTDDISVWNLMFEYPSKEYTWIVVRDIVDDLAYQGWVEYFSDSTDDRELFLRDVSVYRNSDQELLYKMPATYLLVSKGSNFVVELPLWKHTELS